MGPKGAIRKFADSLAGRLNAWAVSKHGGRGHPIVLDELKGCFIDLRVGPQVIGVNDDVDYFLCQGGLLRE